MSFYSQTDYTLIFLLIIKQASLQDRIKYQSFVPPSDDNRAHFQLTPGIAKIGMYFPDHPGNGWNPELGHISEFLMGQNSNSALTML